MTVAPPTHYILARILYELGILSGHAVCDTSAPTTYEHTWKRKYDKQKCSFWLLSADYCNILDLITFYQFS